MKILNICGYTWAIGGPAKIIFDHAQVQLAHGHEVTILTPIWPTDKVYPAPDGAKVVTVRRDWFARFFPEFSIEAYRWLKQHADEFDVIHVHGIFHFAGMIPFLIKAKPAKVITIHGLLDRWAISHGYWKKKIFSFLFQRRIVAKADLVQINNTDELADLSRYLGYQHPNVAIIPNGMRMADFAQLPPKGTFRNHFQIPANQQLILFLARLNIKKGLDLLLPAFEQVAKQRNNCLLLLAGPDDGYLAACQEFITKNKLENKIRLLGMLTGELKLAALSDATLFALPSYSEGFSIAVLEAMSAQLPTLLSDRVGFGETIRETQAGHLVDLTVDSVAAGLTQMLDDQAYCEQLRNNAFELVKSRYDIEIVASQLMAAYQKIIRK